MARQRGDLFLLEVDAEAEDAFTVLGGLRGTALSGTLRPVDVTAKDSGGARTLLDGAGILAFTFTGTGVFDGDAAHAAAQTLFMGRAVRPWRITRGDGSRYTGPCLITRLDHEGDWDGEETFALTVESAGAITFTAGAP